MSREAWLRGLLIGLTLFLVASGAATLGYRSVPAPLQFAQLAHAVVGFATGIVGAVYVAVHVRELRGGARSPLRRPSLLTGISLACVLASMTGIDLGLRTSNLDNPVAMVGVIGLAVSSLRALLRMARRAGSRLVVVGGLAFAMSVFAGLTGVAIVEGVALYSSIWTSAWFVHIVTTALAVLLVGGHLVESRRNRRRPGFARDRSYPWSRPLLTVSLPTFAGIGAVTALIGWRGGASIQPPTLDPAALVPTSSAFSHLQSACEACHPVAVDGWRRSAHANAAANPLFTALVGTLIEQRGPEAARFCLGCHAPHALDPTRGTFAKVTASEGYRAGVHCVTCHRSRPGGGHGDGAIEMFPLTLEPSLFLTERWTMSPDTIGRASIHSLAQVLVAPRIPEHRTTYRFATHEAESCLPCHVQTLAHPTAGRLATVVQDPYDSWASSPAARSGRDCKHCHLPRIVSPDQYLVADHRFLAASTYVARVVGGESAVAEVEATLRGQMPLPGSSRLFVTGRPEPALPSGPLLEMAARIANDARGPALEVTLRNTGRIGHSFPNGPTDLFQVWIAANVTDARGRVLLDVGADGPEGAPRLGHEFRDAAGEPISDHRLWAVAEVIEHGQVPAEGDYTVSFPLGPDPYQPPLAMTASLEYRRFDPAVLARLTGEAAPPLPTVSVATFRGSAG